MRMNINTPEYWERRFSTGNWNRAGKKQTRQYALKNTEFLKICSDFNGSLLDFGCALGDAIPVYKYKFPKASIIGYDISESAIRFCQKKYSGKAEFFAGDQNNLPFVDIIIASHVMEHISDDKAMVRRLLVKCKELYVFVPYKEYPLYIEHINYYNEDYYNELNPAYQTIFDVTYKTYNSLDTILRNLVYLKFVLRKSITKRIIMFHFKN